MTHGLDFVKLYVEDVDGDWLERWEEDEGSVESETPANQAFTSGRLGISILESMTAFLKSDDLVALKVRKRMGERSPSEIAAELEKCLSGSEYHDCLWNAKKILAGSVTGKESDRDGSNGEDEIELLDLAESLLEKLAEIRGKSEED